MNYSEFKMHLMSDISEKIGCDADVSIRKVRKNNGITYDGLTVHPSGINIAPTIYLEFYWKEYLNGMGLDDIADRIISENACYSPGKNLELDSFLDFNRLRDKVMFRLVNYEMNRDLFETVPMHKVLDLAAVYYYEIKNEEFPSATCMVRKEDTERWGITEQDLWKLASENTPRIEPVRIRGICETLRSCCRPEPGMDGITCSDLEDVFKMTEMTPLYVMTNESQIFGASCILYPETMHILADQFGTDLYIFPSSIHEMILMPVDESFDSDELSGMVKEINENEVLPHEVLSDHVYRFLCDRKLICMN